MKDKRWKRFNTYDLAIVINLIVNIFLYIINEDFLNYAIPKNISVYMFWLSLGLYLGFQLCKMEFKRAIKKPESKDQSSLKKV